MKIIMFIALSSLVMIDLNLNAQQSNSLVQKGNEAYRKGDYKNAAELYRQALMNNAGNITAKFNLGNALQKENDLASSEKEYNDAAGNAAESDLKAKAFYNKGLSLIRQKKIQDAIDAFKQSLKLQPADDEARENLQKAMNELKQQQQKQQPQKQQNKQNKPEKKQQNRQPNLQMMEQKFNELRNQEKQLQKMLQKKTTNAQPDKDW